MSFQDAYWAAPPISRTITAAAVLLSVPGHLGLYSLAWVAFLKDYVFTVSQLPQLWRVLTAFFITGPQIGLIMDPFILYRYSTQLETGSPRFSGSGAYAFYLMFVSVIILLTGGVYLGGFFLLSPLTAAMIYTYAQEDPNASVSFFIIQMPAKYIPYASLALTYVMAGPFMAMVQASGIFAAHAYEFFDKVWPQHGGGAQWTQPPQFLQKWFAVPGQTGQTRAYGTAFGARANAPAPAQGQSAGWTSGSAWGTRGAGRRLGSD